MDNIWVAYILGQRLGNIGLVKEMSKQEAENKAKEIFGIGIEIKKEKHYGQI